MGEPVKRVAFIQCVGSRDHARGNSYCSSACCMAAAKEAMVAMEHTEGLEATIFCSDIRAFGKEFDRYIDRARSQGVRYVRAIPSRVVEVPGSKNPRVRYFDEQGEERQEEFDLVVLSVGMRPSAEVSDLAERLGLDRNQFGFCATDRLAPVTHLPAGGVRGGRLPGAQGYPGVGGPGERGRERRHGAAGGGARHAGAKARVPVGAGCHRRGAARRHLHLPLRPQHRLGGGRGGGGAPGGRAAERLPRRGQPLHLLGRHPAAHQGAHPRASAEPPGGRVVLAAHPRAALPGDAPGDGPQPLPLRHDQHPRAVLVGAPQRSRARDAARRTTWWRWRWAAPAGCAPWRQPASRSRAPRW